MISLELVQKCRAASGFAGLSAKTAPDQRIARSSEKLDSDSVILEVERSSILAWDSSSSASKAFTTATLFAVSRSARSERKGSAPPLSSRSYAVDNDKEDWCREVNRTVTEWRERRCSADWEAVSIGPDPTIVRTDRSIVGVNASLLLCIISPYLVVVALNGLPLLGLGLSNLSPQLRRAYATGHTSFLHRKFENSSEDIISLTEKDLLPMLDKISWLHISDFHFQAGRDGFSQGVSCEALVRDIPSRLSEEFPLQFIVVTGDIAFSGKASEYELASTFFASLLEKLGLGAERLCIVPGNHDVDRGSQSYMYEGVRSRLASQWDIDEFLSLKSERSQLMERQAAFREFREGLLFDDDDTGESNEGLAQVRHIDLAGFRVCVLELNSAWLSGDSDRQGNLLIGERQVIEAIETADKADPHLLVALTHHPTDWLAEFDRIACTNRLVPQVDVFHTGHLHAHQAYIMLIPGYQCLHSAAGSSHETRHYKNSYNLLEYHLGDGTCKIRQFEYRTDAGIFQELPGIECELPPRGEIKATPAEIMNVLRESVSEAEPYAGYMAALLTGWKEEVPINLNADNPIFASKRFGPEYQIPEVSHFLRISNLIKIFDTIPLQEMIAGQKAVIRDFATFLSTTAYTNAEFAGFLAAVELQTRKLLGVDSTEGPPHQIQYLEELANSGELNELINTAARYSKSSDEVVRIAARRHLASSYLQQEDPDVRNQGSDLAFQILDEDLAECKDYLLASIAAESIGDIGLSENIALRALDVWPGDSDLRAYCRSFAMQRGSQALRERLDETGGTS